ncbi:MAG: M12 family metallo-peptidase, partial [Chitinophagales bacterium]
MVLKNYLNWLVLFLLIVIGVFPYYTSGQQVSPGNVAATVDRYKSAFPVLPKKYLFNVSSLRRAEEDNILKDYTRINLDKNALKNCLEEAPGGIELTVPYKNSDIELELVKANLFTDDFKVVTDGSGGLSIPYQPGLYYSGTIKGEPSSIATFSFFKDEVIGMISSSDGNIVIGKLLNGNLQTDEYIIYADRDFKIPHSNSCSTYDDPAYATQLAQLLDNAGTIRTNNCVRMYYEADYAIYQNNGINLTTTVNWITAVHNNVATLYSNDNIKTAISEIFVWTQDDPFNATSAVTQLNTFKSFRASFNGDIGQLLTMEPGTLGGVASAINGLCNSDNKYCYSDVDLAFSTVPAYSWTVNVVAHEFGHLLGAYHTHNCNWPGGAIDNCGPLIGFPNEGGTCPLGPAPVDGGTIMSYCHLTTFG